MRRATTYRMMPAAALVALAVGTAAAGEPGANTLPSAPPPTSTSPSVPPADMPFLDPSQVAKHDEGTSWSAVTDVRGDKYADFDRVVFEFAGGPELRWTVWYKKKPEDGASRVDVAGDAYLYLQVNFVAHTSPAKTIDVDGEAVRQVVLTRVWEGAQGALIGVNDRPRPFRVVALTDPPRIIIDVQH